MNKSVHPRKPRRKKRQRLQKELVQDHWILDKKNKRLIRVRITPRKALFTPTGTQECPVNPDNFSHERTTEIIGASEGGDPEIFEDSWRRTSQANKPLTNLWTGKTIVTFGEDSLKNNQNPAQDRQQTGSSTRRASRLLSQILQRHPRKNLLHFRLLRQNSSAIVQTRRAEKAPPSASSYDYRPISI